jgi:hypothetical protein
MIKSAKKQVKIYRPDQHRSYARYTSETDENGYLIVDVNIEIGTPIELGWSVDDDVKDEIWTTLGFSIPNYHGETCKDERRELDDDEIKSAIAMFYDVPTGTVHNN